MSCSKHLFRVSTGLYSVDENQFMDGFIVMCWAWSVKADCVHTWV